MLFLSVRGFLDYAGPNNPLAITWLSCCLPPLGMESASCSIGFSKLNSPAHRYLCLRFKRHLAMPPARLEARTDSLFSFSVGLFHPLQHAGFIPAHSGWPTTRELPRFGLTRGVRL